MDMPFKFLAASQSDDCDGAAECFVLPSQSPVEKQNGFGKVPGRLPRGRPASKSRFDLKSQLTLGSALSLMILAGIRPAEAQSAVSVCSGLSATLPTLTPITNVTDNVLSGTLGGILGASTLTDLNGVVSGVNNTLQTQLSGKNINVGLLNPSTGALLTSANCYISASGLTITNNLGLSMGGGQVIGLGGTANAVATAGDATAIALGNGSSTTTSAVNAIALGTGATVSAANSLALGAASTASRGAQTGYTALGLSSGQTSVGEVSIGSASNLRQITNLAAGSAATDAATIGQLSGTAQSVGNAIASGLGGGASYNVTTGQFTAPVFAIGGQSYTTVATALAAANALAVQYTPNGAGGATNVIDLTKGSTLSPVTISGLAPGTVAAGSTQAINGNQLYNATRYFQTNSTLADATPLGQDSVALGPAATTSSAATNGLALGNSASSLVAGGVALGSGSVASRAAQTYTDPFSGTSVTTVLGAVSVGQAGQERQITNVASGSALTDAVNVGQLTNAIAPISRLSKLGIQYIADSAGNPTAAVNLATGNANLPAGTTQVTLTGLAAATLSPTSTDAVNGSQLKQTNDVINNIQTSITNNHSNLVYSGSDQPLASGVGSVAAGGGGTTASGQFSTAIGFNAKAATQSSVAIGQNTQAMDGLGAVAIGSGNMASGAGSVSIGDPNTVTGTGAVGLGANNTVTGQGAVGIGNLTQSNGQSAVALGDSSIANGFSTIAIGLSANASAGNAIALGNGASATGANSVALGSGSTDGGQSNVVAIGNSGQTRKLLYVSPGTLSSISTDGVNGSQLYATGFATATMLGGGATYNTATGAVTAPSYTIRGNTFNNVGAALGAIDSSLTTIDSKTGLFVSNNAAGAGTAAAAGANSSAGGYGAVATGAASTVIGNGATDNGIANSTLLGNGATITAGLAGTNTAIGQGAVASTGALSNYTAFGLTGSQASAGEVSIGSASAQSRLTNVAAGNAATDAVNVAQLQGVASTIGTSVATSLGGGATYNSTTSTVTGPTYTVAGNTYNNVGGAITALNTSVANQPMQYSTAAAPTTANPGVVSNDVTLIGQGSSVALHNLAGGTLGAGSTDAVNGSQVYAGNVSIANILGGNTTYNTTTGTFTAPTYTVGGNTYSTVSGAVSAINTTINGGAASPYLYVNSSLAAANATGTNAIAVGPAATATGANTVSIGNGAKASGTNSIALGAGSTDGGLANVVSVGAVGSERRIVNVAAGTVGAGSTDAVNGSQLYDTNTRVASLGHASVQYATDANGATQSSVTLASDQGGPVIIHNLGSGTATTDAATVGQVQSATADTVQYSKVDGVRSNTLSFVGGQPGGVVLSNVAPGVQGTDAANLNQVQAYSAASMAQSNAYTDQRVNNLAAYTQQQIAQTRKDAAAGTALALAASGLHYDDRPGKTSISGASAYYHNQMGIAFGIGTTSDDGRLRLNTAVTAAPTQGQPDIGVVVGASLALN